MIVEGLPNNELNNSSRGGGIEIGQCSKRLSQSEMASKLKGDLLEVEVKRYHKEHILGIHGKEVGRHDTAKTMEKIAM